MNNTNNLKDLNILTKVHSNTMTSSSSDTRTIRNIRDIVALVQKEGADAAVLSVVELQAFWLSVMADRASPVAQRLQASKYYADSVGAFGGAGGGERRRVRVRFADADPLPVEAELVSENV